MPARVERGWTAKWYGPGDEESILKMRADVFRTQNVERTNLETWRWQFRDNPSGPGIIRLAVDGETMAGQYVVIPTRFCFRGKETLAALSCDTMVRREYQRQGIFVALAKDVYARAEETGINLVWGFPNDASLPGFLKSLDWFQIATLPIYVRPLRFAPLLGYLLKNRAASAVAGGIAGILQPLFFPVPRLPRAEYKEWRIEKLSRSDESFDELWRRNKEKYPVIQIRDAAYVNWRYFGWVRERYEVFAVRRREELEAFFVVRRREQFGVETGVITDVFPSDLPGDVISFILDYCAAYCREKGCALLVFVCTALMPETYKRNRFVRIPERYAPKTFNFCARCAAPSEMKEAAGQMSNWYLTYGDTDLI